MFLNSARKAHGYAVWSYPDGKQVEKDTLQCCHCGGHFYITPGSGIKRGWCLKCNKPTCGSENCNECFPIEKQIEEHERRDRMYRNMIGG